MGIPYEKTLHIEAVSGVRSVHKLAFPHRGVLRRFAVVQQSGNLDGFTAALYNSNKVSEVADAHQYNIIPAESVPAGEAVLALHGLQHGYVNQDGTPSLPQRWLYLELTVNGSGTKEFDVTLAQESPRFN